MTSIEIECPVKGFKARVFEYSLRYDEFNKRHLFSITCDRDIDSLRVSELLEYRIKKYKFYGQIVSYYFHEYKFELRITEPIYLHLTDNILKE